MLSCLIKLKCLTGCLSYVFIFQLWKVIARDFAIQLYQNFGRLLKWCYSGKVYLLFWKCTYFCLLSFLAMGFHFYVLGKSYKCCFVTTSKRERKEETCEILLYSFFLCFWIAFKLEWFLQIFIGLPNPAVYFIC